MMDTERQIQERIRLCRARIAAHTLHLRDHRLGRCTWECDVPAIAARRDVWIDNLLREQRYLEGRR